MKTDRSVLMLGGFVLSTMLNLAWLFLQKRGQTMGILNSMSEGLQTPKQNRLHKAIMTAQPKH